MKFDEFKQSPKGKIVCEVISDPDWRIEMVCLSKHGLPAAQAVGAEIGRLTGELEDTEKQHVGRAIRDVMAELGWKVATKGARVAPGNFFNRAATYRPASPCLRSDDPIVLRMTEIVGSHEGHLAAIAATKAGLPALAGVDPLLSADLGQDYGKHNMATATAGDLVARQMRGLGYKKAGQKALPSHCVARTADVYVHAAGPDLAA